MTQIVSITELRRRFADVMSQVADGTEFIVTERGRPIVRIIPLLDADEAVSIQAPTDAEGME